MNFRGSRKIALTVWVCLVVFTSSSTLQAQSRELVERSFMYWVPPGQELPDFTDESSLAVLAVGQSSQIGIALFADVGSAPELYGTEWHFRPTRHMTQQGPVDLGYFSWKVDDDHPVPPSAGTITFTGPDSPFVLSQKVYFLKPCTSATCGSVNSNKWYAPLSGGTERVVVVTALFYR